MERVKWLDRFKTFKQAEERRAANFDSLVRSDIDTVQVVIDKKLNSIEWPREALVSYEISDDKKSTLDGRRFARNLGPATESSRVGCLWKKAEREE